MRVKRRIASIATWAGHTYPGRLIAAFGASQAGNYASGHGVHRVCQHVPADPRVARDPRIRDAVARRASRRSGAILGFFPQRCATRAGDGVRRRSSSIRGSSASSASSACSGAAAASSPAMEFSLGMVIGVRQRNFLRQRAMALVMTILFVARAGGRPSASTRWSRFPGLIWVFEPLVGLVVWCALHARGLPTGSQPHLPRSRYSGRACSSPAPRWRS